MEDGGWSAACVSETRRHRERKQPPGSVTKVSRVIGGVCDWKIVTKSSYSSHPALVSMRIFTNCR